jgi:hypothetical protein
MPLLRPHILSSSSFTNEKGNIVEKIVACKQLANKETTLSLIVYVTYSCNMGGG